MEFLINLKRRRDMKNHPKKKKHSQTPSLPQPKGEKKITKSQAQTGRPAQIIPPPQQPKNTPLTSMTSHSPQNHLLSRPSQPPN